MPQPSTVLQTPPASPASDAQPVPSSATPQPKRRRRVPSPHDDPELALQHQLSQLSQQSEQISHDQKLTTEQEAVMNYALEGKNIFFSGGAGTGKTVLLRAIIEELRRQGKAVEVTASTGVAATHLNGRTIHSFAGFGTGNGSLDDLRSMARKSTAWKRAEVLVIDEMSMLNAAFFDALEDCARHVRESSLVFGGLQVIACGDFLQLPPVSRNHRASYAFQAECWERVFPAQYTLSTVLRQHDADFIETLQRVREGTADEQVQDFLRLLARPLAENNVAPTQLCSRNEAVDLINRRQLSALSGAEWKFETLRLPSVDYNGEKSAGSAAHGSNEVPADVVLKQAASVLVTRNLSRDVSNGTRGVVLAFEHYSEHAGAMPRAQADVRDVQSFLNQYPKVPIVKFANGSVRAIFPQRTVGLTGAFVQLPLRLGWAITIHRCQGMTLDRVVVDLEQASNAGQVYVALSRARDSSGLQVLNFEPKYVVADPNAKKFHAALLRRPLPVASRTATHWKSKSALSQQACSNVSADGTSEMDRAAKERRAAFLQLGKAGLAHLIQNKKHSTSKTQQTSLHSQPHLGSQLLSQTQRETSSSTPLSMRSALASITNRESFNSSRQLTALAKMRLAVATSQSPVLTGSKCSQSSLPAASTDCSRVRWPRGPVGWTEERKLKDAAPKARHSAAADRETARSEREAERINARKLRMIYEMDQQRLKDTRVQQQHHQQQEEEGQFEGCAYQFARPSRQLPSVAPIAGTRRTFAAPASATPAQAAELQQMAAAICRQNSTTNFWATTCPVFEAVKSADGTPTSSTSSATGHLNVKFTSVLAAIG
eukprot:NODE_216_length_2699_cov_43.609811_g198_i0.p1 GENE.NODE_216_length_2699_cov_43.609811_g198_i0~~NODE_216_length_2699_cov_43.609811_g198_i0.p1  ORF type:complete len:828 (+),score=152.50 NODE_216_length_2699_cov_43.609811_g198_i0:89-2572(+)